MINLKRIIHVQERDHTHYCQHHCALCKNPCEKQGRYPTLPGAHTAASDSVRKPDDREVSTCE